MSVTETIRSLAATFTPSERKLVDCLIVRPQQAALGTASEFARQVGVHEATASRLARKLGFESYASFRRAVQAQFLPTQEPATRIDASLRAASGSDILEILVRQEVEALAAIPQQIDAATLDAAAQEMVQAGRLFFFAQGNAELLALMMTKRFRRFGCDAAQLSADPRALAEQLLGLRQGDLVVAFVFRRAPRVYAPMMRRRRRRGPGPWSSPAASGRCSAPPPTG